MKMNPLLGLTIWSTTIFLITVICLCLSCSKKNVNSGLTNKIAVENVKQQNELRKMEGNDVPLEAPEKENDIEALMNWKPGTIYFDFDEWVLNGESLKELGKLCDKMHDNPDLKLKITGHCDERGSAEYNMALGQKRADTPKEYLKHCGIDKNRITTISYGEEYPLSERYDLNRRCEFELK